MQFLLERGADIETRIRPLHVAVRVPLISSLEPLRRSGIALSVRFLLVNGANMEVCGNTKAGFGDNPCW